MASGTTNEEQIEYWNTVAGPKWVRMQASLDEMIAPLGEAMLRRADLRPGESALDIGCGCGATSLAAGNAVGPDGKVVGIDISAPMLEVAKSRAVATGLKQVGFLRADAQTHQFEPEAFDAVISRFGVMFFADPDSAFANLSRALRPGGRVHFVCWRPMSENPWMAAPLVAASMHVEMPEAPGPEDPGPFSFASEARVRRILTAGGFDQIGLERLDGDISLGGGADPEEAARFIADMGPVSRLLENASRETREKVHRSIVEAIRPYTKDKTRMPYGAWLVSAIKP